ncbi:MAG: 23S rRNA (guanosine-2'-O-)-methyltransferase RlmB [Chlamydiales bacterium]|nr:23S rRNA (guanosine-2'-O-)-methyltransferase RlmB [Chlamydiales bacterium]MCH9635113.1 23S rRNA (guanosine-2'-O-)-methyltransferase RlmB [Chlamydiales bacterium]MCH9703829.1 RNA methyltransferase [Chlamydiota bacterium]
MKITSLDNPLVKHYVKLREKRRYREEHNSILVASKKLVEELSADFERKSCIDDASEAVFRKVTGHGAPGDLVAEFEMPKPSSLSGLDFILVLDGVQDPGNLGMLLRTALALGWQGVLFLEGCCDPFNEKALSASRAALFYLPFAFGDLSEIEAPILVADLKGEAPTRQSGCALVLGNEGSGPRVEGRRVSIPQSGKMESLNVAAAGSILMYSLTHG